MSVVLRIPLETSPEQSARLRALQAAFAQVCNALAPMVQSTRTWNRVALHHMAYRQLREQFPLMGSQMVCNAIYSVSRTSRAVFQNASSPFALEKLEGKSLPLLRFADSCPVYFDRHTLSLKDSTLSMYTLDGRIRFQLALAAQHKEYFQSWKLREVVLRRHSNATNPNNPTNPVNPTNEQFALTFTFTQPQDAASQAAVAVMHAPFAANEGGDAMAEVDPVGPVPEYIVVEEVSS